MPELINERSVKRPLLVGAAEHERRWVEEKKRAAEAAQEHDSLKQQAEFPIDALGKTLADAARAIAKIIQCPLSTAAGVVLAAGK